MTLVHRCLALVLMALGVTAGAAHAMLTAEEVYISGPVSGGQNEAAVAFDGTNYTVVWCDFRSGSSDIYGARVSVDGNVLDAEGVAISAAAGNQYEPAIAFDGTNYLVVWRDDRSGAWADVYGARVGVDGTVLDPGGIAISTAAGDQWHPAVASNGTACLVVWQDRRAGGGGDIYAARVSKAGSVLDPAGIAISAGVRDETYPEVAYGGPDFLLVWDDNRDVGAGIYGARVTAEGIVLDPTGLPISTAGSQQFPAVAFGGSEYLVVWQSQVYMGTDLYGARVNQAGVVLDPAGIQISEAAGSQWNPDVSFGTSFLVVWENCCVDDYTDVYGARVDQSGALLDPVGFPICTGAYDQQRPAVASDGVSYLAAWEDWRTGSDEDIRGALLQDVSNVPVPALSKWGPTGLALLLVSLGALLIVRRGARPTSDS